MAGHWLASGQENEAFEREFAELIGVPFALCVNSGSSANLIALAALNLPKGSKVLTSACGFPATLSPILHLGLEPVLVDYDLATHNIDVVQVLDRLPEVRAVILAHTMGSPVDMRPIEEAAHKHGVYVIEDCCEALGAKLDGRHVGAWGDLGTYSFYPSHQITALGGGGMVTFKDAALFHRAKSLRDWGKSAMWDQYGRNNTAYTDKVDGLAYFPHYVYETVGWNMKLPEANAAFGREQLRRLDWVVDERLVNYLAIREGIKSDRLMPVKKVDGADPSWFGVTLTLRDGLDRNAFGDDLERRGVRHRPFFAGNITRHKPFSAYRQAFPVADFLMRQSCFVGCWAGMSGGQIRHVINSINGAIDGIDDCSRLR